MIKEFKFDNHDEWLAIRSNYIGGSDAGAVIGMNPYKSRYALWAEKTKKIPAFEGNITTKVGAYLEDLVATMYEEETGKKVRRKNSTMVNDLYPYACANIDRAIVGEKALLEIKTTNSIPLMRALRNSNEFPDAYYTQCVHYLAVTGLEKAYLAVLINCREFKVYELERDQAEIDALMQAEKDFWHLVETNTPPSVDGEESTSDTLKLLYPESTARDIDLTAFDLELKEYDALSKRIKLLEKMKDEKANAIKEFMRDADSGKCGDFKVSFKSSSRTSFDYKALQADNKDTDYSQYIKTTSSRIFKVTNKGDK